jgi:Sap, sulfolipid-1-addressing protein
MALVITIALLGLLASVSPSTLVVFILLLATVRARVNAAAFLIGWSISLTVVFAVSYAVGGVRVTQSGNGSIAVGALEILLGVALAVAAVQQWRRRDRPRASSGVTKKFSARLKELKPWEAAVVGILEQPWTLTAAAAVVLVRHHSAFLVVLFAFLVFALLSTATVGVIFVYFARRPGQAEAHLSDLRNRLVQAGPAIFAIVSAAVGIYLIVDGVTGIVGSLDAR